MDLVSALTSRDETDVNKALASGCTPLTISSYLGRANLVELLLGLSMCDVSLEHAGKTAYEWAQPSVRYSPWSFLDNKIDEDGRAKVCALLLPPAA